MRRRGFTIVEVSYVLAVMSVVVAITIPAHELVLRRAQADEARTLLTTILHAELRHFRDTGRWLPCPASGEVPRATERWFPAEPCWKALVGEASFMTRYRYGVVVSGEDVELVAEGDLDGDGQLSEYRLDGRTQRLDVKDGLE